MLSKNLDLIRRMWGFGQKDFADMLGVTQPMYQTYEKGKREPSIDFIIDLSEITGIPIKKLWRGEVTIKDVPEKPLSKNAIVSEVSNIQDSEESLFYGEINKIKQHLIELEQKFQLNQ